MTRSDEIHTMNIEIAIDLCAYTSSVERQINELRPRETNHTQSLSDFVQVDSELKLNCWKEIEWHVPGCLGAGDAYVDALTPLRRCPNSFTVENSLIQTLRDV